jgi:hypothetical protein
MGQLATVTMNSQHKLIYLSYYNYTAPCSREVWDWEEAIQ